MHNELVKLIRKYPELESCAASIMQAFEAIRQSYRSGGKLLVCGNGGSAADSEHIVGELMKGFMYKRPVSANQREKFLKMFPDNGGYLADQLQGALPAISLVSQTSLATAFINDQSADMVYAQQVFGYGKPGDVLVGLSTSGNSKNVVHALQVARVLGLTTIGLSGQGGGKMNELCDVLIRVPYESTPDIQERHLPIYHALCMMLEQEFFTQ
jgi:D-sedoheptulose 7-phosphate isomerase